MDNFSRGISNHPSYSRYHGMVARCYNDGNISYKNYGGRGIIVCNEWLEKPRLYLQYIDSLENAYVDGYSVDRIDNNGNYEPDNLRWATIKQQQNNRRVYKTGIDSKNKFQDDMEHVFMRLYIEGFRTGYILEAMSKQFERSVDTLYRRLNIAELKERMKTEY